MAAAQEAKELKKAKALAKKEDRLFVVPDKKAVTPEMKERESHNVSKTISGIIALAKFSIQNAQNLGAHFKQVKINQAYQVIKARGIFTDEDVKSVEDFAKHQLRKFKTEDEGAVTPETPTENVQAGQQ